MTYNNCYRALWSAVILQAFRDMKSWSPHGDGSKQDLGTIKNNAYRWINEKDVSYTNRARSFEWVCDMLDISPRERRLLKEMSKTREGINRVLSGQFTLGEV